MAPTPVGLKQPSAIQLSRLSDRMSFLYLDRAAIEQDDNGTRVRILSGPKELSAYLPVATLTCLMLGHGTSVTQQAVAHLNRAGCSVTFVGAGSVRSYGTFLSPYSSTTLLHQQAKIFADDEQRIAAAKRMYAMRFPDELLFAYAPDDVTVEQLRGIEGVRMKGVYQAEARMRRLTKWRRYNGLDRAKPMDPVNIAINYANTALYGVVNSVVLSLGLSPGLGIIHSGNRQSFVLDIADLYKAEITIPLAFSLHKSPDPGNDALRLLRQKFALLKLIPRIVDDIHAVLDVNQNDGNWDVDELFLWGEKNSIAAGPNHAALPLVGGQAS